MDETVFPTGRWFWSGTRQGETVFYIDFNYMHGSVGSENLSRQLPDVRLKTALLVSRADHGDVVPDVQGVEPSAKTDQVPEINPDDRKRLVDLLITLPILARRRPQVCLV